MCGIAGVFYKGEGLDAENAVRRMVNALRHRGPNAQRVLACSQEVFIGHARLSIQDLSEYGSQPMLSSSGRCVIAFNGEVYNFLNLREELIKKGIAFVGGSDTEVVLKAIEHWGLDKALQRFEGMFAFALWDHKAKELILCRDRIGEKPLFYGWHKGAFVWASELKALAALPEWSADIRTESVSAYLKYGYVPTPYSIYKNIYKLIPGSYLKVSAGLLKEKSSFSPYDEESGCWSPKLYWDFSGVISQPISQSISYDDAVDELDLLLVGAVHDQMISDVPYGAFLSGGVDSSVVASIMQSLSADPVKTFTIGFEEKDYNEAPYARDISSHLGTDHSELFVSSKDCLELVPMINQIMDEPFADSSVLPAYFVSEMASNSVTVCLSGDGGDELFCGYNRYVMPKYIMAKIERLPKYFREIISRVILILPLQYVDKIFTMLDVFLKTGNTRVGLKLQKLSRLICLNDPAKIYDYLVSYCSDYDKVIMREVNESLLLSNRKQEAITHLDDAASFMALDLLTYLPDDNLTKVDRASMASSLETRLPLLNHKVIEFSWSIPLDLKYRNGITKSILRDVLYRRVPKELIDRPKMGFSVPIANWLRGELRSWAEELLHEPDGIEGLALNQKRINYLWEEHQSGKRDNSAPLWSLLMFKSWNVERSDTL